MHDEQQQIEEGPKVEAVRFDNDVIAQSLIEPVAFPEGCDMFLLVPVECPEGIYEKRIIIPAYYEAHCVRYHKYPYRGGTKICLTWSFFLSGCSELLLPQHFNVKEEIKSSTKYFRHWIRANGGKRPRASRLEYMSPRIFLQKTAIVYVGPSVPKHPDGTPMEEQCTSAIVEYVKEFTTNVQPSS